MIQDSILFLGYGYTASFAAPALSKLGYCIYGTKRNINNASKGSPIISLLNFKKEDLLPIFSQLDHVIISTPPDLFGTDPSLQLFNHLMQEAGADLKSVIYLSSTGVYGDHKGKWVDEDTTPQPNNARVRSRLEAELGWKDLCSRYDIPLITLRLAGIYGPIRNALTQVSNGTAISVHKKGQVFSRIHVEDIAKIICLIISKPDIVPGIYNLADDYPSSATEVNSYAAQLLDLPEPKIIPFNKADLSAMSNDFYSSCRRIRNHRIKQLLDIDLIYPDYRCGLEKMCRNREY